METLKSYITESNFKPSFDVRSDIYNVLTDLAFEYDKKNKNLDQNEWEEALEWFVLTFFEDNAEGLL
jgi:hypothetical protein